MPINPAPTSEVVRRIIAGTASFLGRGLKSPLREDPDTGDFQRVSGEDNVKQCLRDGLLTTIGERVMREGLGTIVSDMTFAESEVVTDLAPTSIKDFAENFEPRVIVQSVIVKKIESSANMAAFKVSVVYIIKATNTRENMTFPFWIVDGDEGA